VHYLRRHILLPAIILYLLLAVFGATRCLGDYLQSSASVIVPLSSRQPAASTSGSRGVYFRLNDDAGGREAAEALGRRFRARVMERPERPGLYLMELPSDLSPDDVAARLSNHPDVASAHRQMRITDCAMPNDPYFGSADDPPMPEHPSVHQEYLFQIRAPEAWDLQTGSADTVIAVVDSGVSIYHEDLVANLWQNTAEVNGTEGVDDDGNGWVDDFHGWDFVGQNPGASVVWDPADVDNEPTVWDPAWWPEDYVWDEFNPQIPDVDAAIGNADDDNEDGIPDLGVMHGTEVASFAAATTNNGRGLAGVAYNCSIMPVRVTDPEGNGDGFDAADGIRYAAASGADIINCSWGAEPGDFDPANYSDPDTEEGAIYEAIQYAVGRGCIVVCAAGNSGAEGLAFPAVLPETISVGMTEMDNTWAGSNYAAPDETLDIVAPGWNFSYRGGVNDMYSWCGLYLVLPEFGAPDMPPDNDDKIVLGEDLYLPNFGGTSFSAPLVSGFAGLARTRYPDLPYWAFRDILWNSADDSIAGGYDPYYGYGMLDCYEGLQYGDRYIPEPVTAGLFLTGLAALGWRLRGRRREE